MGKKFDYRRDPPAFDPRDYLGAARGAVKEMARHKIVDVLGSNGKLN